MFLVFRLIYGNGRCTGPRSSLLGLVTILKGEIMTFRSGVYIVPTHRWYIERTVWLIAGFVLIGSTALASLVDPRWVLGILATGLASILVALTGFCIVGNVLSVFGFTPMLGTNQPKGRGFYFMQTDRWYLERRIYLAVGINISIASVLTLVHSRWWLTFTGFVGLAMVWFAATGYCIMANGLYWLGAEPRLAPEQGRECATPPPAEQAVKA
jgi:hypothetical protein